MNASAISVNVSRMRTQAVKGITFDVWETILFEKSGEGEQRNLARRRNVSQALKKLGVEASVEQVAFALDKTVALLLEAWKENKDLTHVDQLRAIIRFAWKDSAKIKSEWLRELSDAYASPIHEIPPYLNPDIRAVLESLRGEKQLGIICNTGITPGFALKEFLSRQKIAEYFDAMIFSDEVGIRKPEPKIFRLAARKLGVKPNETVHIGDNIKCDVWGAKLAGFKAIHLSGIEGRDKIAENNPKSLVTISRSLGILRGSQMPADQTITMLGKAIEAIRKIENSTKFGE
jgi:putative hydrolase of the HAD superfamily